MAKKNPKNLSSEEKKEIAFDLFMNTDKSQKEISEIIKVTQKTMGKWVTEGLWRELKSAGTITAQRIINNIYKQMADLTESGGNIEADKLIKLAGTIEKISNKKLSISNRINVFKEEINFIYARDPDFAKKLNLYQKELLEDRVNGH